jgi:hypothetical protein
MQLYIAIFIHDILSLNIDYTFKRIDGALDEWEVAEFLDRFKQRESFVVKELHGFSNYIIQVLHSPASTAAKKSRSIRISLHRTFLILFVR